MGYQSTFDGSFTVTPPLNPAEITYLNLFAQTRHVHPDPYATDADDIPAGNKPPPGMPDLYCQWIPTGDGTELVWDGGEKFCAAEEWIAWLIDHLLRPGAHASRSDRDDFARFTFDHVVTGDVHVQGEEPTDRYTIHVTDNQVIVR